MNKLGIIAVALVVCIVAQALGFPLAGLLRAGAFMAAAGGAGLLVVGAQEMASRSFGVAVELLVGSLGAEMMGGFVRASLTEPKVQGGLCLLLAGAFVVGLVLLLARAAEVEVRLPPRPRMPLQERSSVVPPLPEAPPWGRSSDDEPIAREDRADDDTGLFGRGRGR